MRKLATFALLGILVSCSLTTPSGLFTSEQTPERNGLPVLPKIHPNLFRTQRHRATRTISDMSKVFGSIDVNTFTTTKHIAESIYKFINCAENNNFKMKVDMPVCELKPILTCFHDGDTGLVSGSVSSDLALSPDLKPDGRPKLDVQKYCNTIDNEQSISGLALEIPGRHSVLGTGQNFTAYSGRFDSCNTTMLMAAIRARKSITVRKRLCDGSHIHGRPPTTPNLKNSTLQVPGHDNLTTVPELIWTSTEETTVGSSSFGQTLTAMYSGVEITTAGSANDTGAHTSTELSGLIIFLIVIFVLALVIAVVYGTVVMIRKRYRFRRVPTEDFELPAR